MKYIKATCAIIATLYCLPACKDVNNMHQEYLDRGETVYTAKVDSVKYYLGRESVRFVFQIKADPRIAKIEIRWNEGATAKKHEVPVNRASGEAATAEATIDNIPEGSYNFVFITFDDAGNRSMNVEQIVDILGDAYASMLSARLPALAVKFGNGVLVKWGESTVDDISSEVTYTASDGTMKTRTLLHSESPTWWLDDYAGDLKCVSEFSPANSTATFRSPSRNCSLNDVSCPPLSKAAPAVLSMMNFDYGGEGVAYHDSDAGNNGGSNYRANLGDENCGVDIEGNPPNIGWSDNGEWLIYTVEALDAGDYVVDIRNSVNTGDGADFLLTVDGAETTATYHMENNGSWNDWKWYFSERHPEIADKPVISLSKGVHKIRFNIVQSGFNMRDLQFTYKR